MQSSIFFISSRLTNQLMKTFLQNKPGSLHFPPAFSWKHYSNSKPVTGMLVRHYGTLPGTGISRVLPTLPLTGTTIRMSPISTYRFMGLCTDLVEHVWLVIAITLYIIYYTGNTSAREQPGIMQPTVSASLMSKNGRHCGYTW